MLFHANVHPDITSDLTENSQEKRQERGLKGKKLNKGQRGIDGKLEERSSKEYNLITSRESGGHGGGEGAAPCQSVNSGERFWMSFIPQSAGARI